MNRFIREPSRTQFSTIVRVVTATIPVINAHLPDGKGLQTGAQIKYVSDENGLNHQALAGTLSDEEEIACLSYVNEKLERLRKNQGHLTSRRTRDIAAERYIGAVRIGNWRIGASGLLEPSDEATILYALTLVMRLSTDEIEEILNDSPIAVDEVRFWLNLFTTKLSKDLTQVLANAA